MGRNPQLYSKVPKINLTACAKARLTIVISSKVLFGVGEQIRYETYRMYYLLYVYCNLLIFQFVVWLLDPEFSLLSLNH